MHQELFLTGFIAQKSSVGGVLKFKNYKKKEGRKQTEYKNKSGIY